MTITEPKQICTVNIMFPVESDDQAIAVKKKIAELLSDMPLVRIDFNLVSVPRKPPDQNAQL